jgi:hypothetical protein
MDDPAVSGVDYHDVSVEYGFANDCQCDDDDVQWGQSAGFS